MCRCPSLSRYSALPSLRSRLPALVLKFTSREIGIGAKHTRADELLFDDEFDDKQLDLAKWYRCYTWCNETQAAPTVCPTIWSGCGNITCRCRAACCT